MYISISFVVLVLSFVLFRKASGSLSLCKFNMISYIFYINIILQSFLGSILIMQYEDLDPIITFFVNISDDSIKFKGWLSVLYTMISLPVGMLLANRYYRVESVNILLDQYLRKPLVCISDSKDYYLRYSFYLLSLLSFISVIYTYLNLLNIPWVGVFSNYDTKMLSVLREEAGSGFQGIALIRQLFGTMLTPVLTYVAYTYWKMTNSTTDRYWFYLLYLLSFFILSHSLAKSPFVMFVFGFIFLLVAINGQVNLRILLMFTSICLLLLVVIYFYIMDLSSFSEIFFTPSSGLVWRIIVSQIAGLYGSFAVFPYHHNHIDFISTSSFLSSFFEVEKLDASAKIVMRFLTPEGVDEGIAGYANSLFIAEAWAHFGWIGVIITPFIVGFIVQSSYLLLLKAPKSPAFIGLYAYLSYRWGVTTSLFSFIFNPELFIFLAFYLTAIKLSRNSYLRSLDHPCF